MSVESPTLRWKRSGVTTPNAVVWDVISSLSEAYRGDAWNGWSDLALVTGRSPSAASFLAT
jgi:hypothetical protein